MQDFQLIQDVGGIEDISYLYLARNIYSQETVSLKYTDLTLSTDYELIQELQRTIQNTKNCSHENILPYYNSFIDEEHLWIVTSPSKRGTCKNILKNEFTNGIPLKQVAFILKSVLKALVYLHENHMIHNDIRSDNIVVDLHGQIKLTGLRQVTHLARNGEFHKSVFSLIGDNVEWAAPEIMAQNSDYNCSADIYSIGMTALELAHNQTPFDGWPPLKILLSKMEYPVPKIPSDTVNDRNFFDFVTQCLRRDPAERPTAKVLLKHPFIRSTRLQRL